MPVVMPLKNNMKILLPIFFATIAAVGNAMFALGQKRSVNAENGLLFVGRGGKSEAIALFRDGTYR